MILDYLTIDRFRNLKSVTVEPDPSFNIIYGGNGAGKSSILEAVECLSTGHSFRTRRIAELVNHESDDFELSCRFSDPQSKIAHRCGLMRSRHGETSLRLNFEDIKGFTPVTQLLAVKALVPDSHQLVQEGPGGRRQFLDWGAFHMHSEFDDAWRRYRRALLQRNHLLREGEPDKEIKTWDLVLAEAGEQLGQFRQSYLDKLTARLHELTADLELMFHVELEYRSGWAKELPLIDVLGDNLLRCRRFKTTTAGPHRADLIIHSDGYPAKQVLSRGQQKMLVYALHLAQLQTLHELTGRKAVLLCDDVLSELDVFHVERIVMLIRRLECQVFFTSAAPELLKSVDAKRFHVDNGGIKKSI